MLPVRIWHCDRFHILYFSGDISISLQLRDWGRKGSKTDSKNGDLSLSMIWAIYNLQMKQNHKKNIFLSLFLSSFFRGGHFFVNSLTEAFFFLLHLRIYFCQSSKAKQSWLSHVLKDWGRYTKLFWLQNPYDWSIFDKCLRQVTLYLLQQYSAQNIYFVNFIVKHKIHNWG